MGMAPTAAPAMISAMAGNTVVAGMSIAGTMTYGEAATAVLIGTGALGTAYAGSDIIEAQTDLNPIKDAFYHGNDELYEEHQNVLNGINTTTVIVGTMATLDQISQSPSQKDILKDKNLTNQTKKVDNYVSDVKGEAAARADFESMNPVNVKTYPNGTTVGYLSDGRTINMHPSTTLSGTPSVEIYDPVSGRSIKIRY